VCFRLFRGLCCAGSTCESAAGFYPVKACGILRNTLTTCGPVGPIDTRLPPPMLKRIRWRDDPFLFDQPQRTRNAIGINIGMHRPSLAYISQRFTDGLGVGSYIPLDPSPELPEGITSTRLDFDFTSRPRVTSRLRSQLVSRKTHPRFRGWSRRLSSVCLSISYGHRLVLQHQRQTRHCVDHVFLWNRRTNCRPYPEGYQSCFMKGVGLLLRCRRNEGTKIPSFTMRVYGCRQPGKRLSCVSPFLFNGVFFPS
jgi:hypothetical protein